MNTNIILCITPLLLLIIFPAGALFFRWLEGWLEGRKKTCSCVSQSSARSPYRMPPVDHVWRFVKVHVSSAFSCPVCNAGKHDDCDVRCHQPSFIAQENEWPVWAL